jgi:hypothetical protein
MRDDLPHVPWLDNHLVDHELGTVERVLVLDKSLVLGIRRYAACLTHLPDVVLQLGKLGITGLWAQSDGKLYCHLLHLVVEALVLESDDVARAIPESFPWLGPLEQFVLRVRVLFGKERSQTIWSIDHAKVIGVGEEESTEVEVLVGVELTTVEVEDFST